MSAYENNSLPLGEYREKPSGLNFWNNSEQEGNYWSNYIGLDNGADGRISGDGIGDTAIPYLGRDNYPFIQPWGWLLPDPPFLSGPGTDNDGNFTLTWNSTDMVNFILQETSSNSFDRNTTTYEIRGLSIDITNKTDGMYFYRVKGLDGKTETRWSNVIAVTVGEGEDGGEEDGNGGDEGESGGIELRTLITLVMVILVALVFLAQIGALVRKKKGKEKGGGEEERDGREEVLEKTPTEQEPVKPVKRKGKRDS